MLQKLQVYISNFICNSDLKVDKTQSCVFVMKQISKQTLTRDLDNLSHA